MAKAIEIDLFHGEGRGPELLQCHWSSDGRTLLGIDYYTDDATHEPDSVRHVRFIGIQVIMFTPEEVAAFSPVPPSARIAGACLFDLGHDAWFVSFTGRHLGGCSHYHLEFYDEYVDVICKGVECGLGALDVGAV